MQDDLRCTKCGMTFKAGKVYGYACMHGLNCGPMVPITEPLPPWWPRQDVQLPPRWPEAAEITALRARLAQADACNRGLVRLNEATEARAIAAEAERDRLREAMAEKLRVKPLVWTRARDGYPYEWEAWCDLMGGYYYANTDPQKREIGAVRAARILAALTTKGEADEPLRNEA